MLSFISVVSDLLRLRVTKIWAWNVRVFSLMPLQFIIVILQKIRQFSLTSPNQMRILLAKF
jgi:hypothetical protein